jgi:hypothetical protein
MVTPTLNPTTANIIYPDTDGQPFLSFIDLDLRRQAAEQRASTAEQQSEKLAAKLRELGIDPANL